MPTEQLTAGSWYNAWFPWGLESTLQECLGESHLATAGMMACSRVRGASLPPMA